VADKVADLKRCALAGGDDLADGAALQSLADLEWRDVALAVNHATSHIRVDGHPDVAHQDFAVFRVGHGG
jgi:hypothetical protein